MSKEPKRNVYVGHRYVPKIMGEWNKQETYEGLSIVTNEGTSYTSKKRVPVGIDILNEEYWVVTGNYNAQVEAYRQEVRSFDSRITEVNEDLQEFTNKTDQDLIDRGVNLRSLGAKLDGVTDDYEIVMSALYEYDHVVIPYGTVLATSQTIVIKPNQSLMAGGKISRLPTIKYIGEVNREKTVVQIGLNGVGEEPNIHSNNITFSNINVDGDYKVGFCVYGTYLTNETIIENITVTGSTEYNMYFAKGWYAKLQNLTSKHCLNNGIALGMPLIYSNGYEVNWNSHAPLELNNMKIDDIRSTRSGSFFWEDNPGLFDIMNESHQKRGWGLGFGIGNGFRVENFLSERSGGVALYVYNGSQPSKTIKNGYIENSQEFGSTDNANEKCSMIIHNTHTSGGTINIEDIYIHHTSGGIYHKGEVRTIQLRNIHQPKFLRSLESSDKLPPEGVYEFILKDNVYWECGVFDQRESKGLSVETKEVNTRYDWDFDINKPNGTGLLLYMRKINDDDNDPIGGYRLRRRDGTSNDYSYPSDLTNDFKFIRNLSIEGIKLVKSGGEGDYDCRIEIKVVIMPPTHY